MPYTLRTMSTTGFGELVGGLLAEHVREAAAAPVPVAAPVAAAAAVPVAAPAPVLRAVRELQA